MKTICYIIAMLMCLLTTTVYAKEEVMTDEKIDWAEYGRIEKGELNTEVQLIQEDKSVFAELIFTNVSKRELHLFMPSLHVAFFGLEVLLNNQKLKYIGEVKDVNPHKSMFTNLAPSEKIEQTIDLMSNFRFPENAVGELTVKYTTLYAQEEDKIHIDLTLEK